MSRVFYATICTLFAVTLGLVALAFLRMPDPPPPVVDVPSGRIAEIVVEAAAAADARIADLRAAEMVGVFAPAHAAVPAYADFHYSLRGEYVELYQAITGGAAKALQERLFGGFDDRLSSALGRIDTEWRAHFEAALSDEIEAELRAEDPAAVPGTATQIAIADARDRMAYTVPLGAAMATGGGAMGAKAVATLMSKALANKLGLLAGKTAGKAAGIGGGAATGAMIGATLGPFGAVLGGLSGGIATWFAADAAVIRIDEAWNREAFEDDLHALIDEERARIDAALDAALAARQEAISGTLRDLARP